MWHYAAGAVVVGTIALAGRILYKAQKEDELYIDMERVNREARDQELDELDSESSDMCKARVKRRMKLGEACSEPPLFNGKKRLHLVEAQRTGSNVA
jgi:hypothetical protein